MLLQEELMTGRSAVGNEELATTLPERKRGRSSDLEGEIEGGTGEIKRRKRERPIHRGLCLLSLSQAWPETFDL